MKPLKIKVEGLLKAVKKGRGGISIAHHKNTAGMRVIRIPTPPFVQIAMTQGIGAPCTPVVKVGDYVKEGEKLVKINGLKPAQTSLYDTGSVIKHEETKFLSEKMCKIISVFFGILSFILVFMFDTNKDFLLKKKDKKSFVAGVPVYDLPQI